MHFYNQGYTTLRDSIDNKDVDLIMLQEHWLTPANLNRFSIDFVDYYCFGLSSLDDVVSAGPLYGRPFGGMMMLLKNNLMPVSNCIHASERFVVVRVGDLICINVYFPCVGTVSRQLICEDMLSEICSWRCKYAEYNCVIGGDFNTDLDNGYSISEYISRTMLDNNFVRCDTKFPSTVNYTYANESLNHFSKIDFLFYNNVTVHNFEICDPDINFSDHLPLLMTCHVNFNHRSLQNVEQDKEHDLLHPRWDHADVLSYYIHTQAQLQPILNDLFFLENLGNNGEIFDLACIDDQYEKIVESLKLCASIAVPLRRKNFFKFWWSQELDSLKESAIESDKTWKAAGRPRSGPLYTKRSVDKRAYRSAVRKNQRESEDSVTNDLHDALISKHGTEFWKCWNAKFNNKSVRTLQVDGSIISKEIANNFARHFDKSCSVLTKDGSDRLFHLYEFQRSNYVGSPMSEEHRFDAELVETVIGDMKLGKAAGLDGLTVEHLINCHPILPGLLARLFNLIIRTGHVPVQFGLSYTVPLIKVNGCTKNLSVDDFRGISISPVISKIFEHCILRRFSNYFVSSDNQFGFKKSVGCSHAIYTVRSVIDHYVSNGSTINLCALDVSKAFDRS
jgi:endonuclease/exonuclease/phosphatase family metal-dependent hydrolase